MTTPDPATEPIAWAGTGDGEFPYRAWHAGSHLHLRVNDFPAEPLYTLFVDYRPVRDLEDWPAPWLRPAPTADQLRIAGTEQLRRGRVDAIVIADWAHRLCTAPAGPAAAVLAALGLPADRRSLEAPPPGLTRFELAEEAGLVSTIRLAPTGGGPSRTELTALLGPAIAAEPPAAGPGTGENPSAPGLENGEDPHGSSSGQARLRVRLTGAPFSCDITVGNGGVVLRRHPNSPAQARRGR